MLPAHAFENLGWPPGIHIENPQTCLAVAGAIFVEGKLLPVRRPGRENRLGGVFEGELPKVLSIDVGDINVNVALGLQAFKESHMLPVWGYIHVPDDFRIQENS